MEKDNNDKDLAKSLSEKIQNSTLEELEFICKKWGPFEWIDVNVKKAMYADKHKKLFSENIPKNGMKIKDNESQFYVKARTSADYYKNYEGHFTINIDDPAKHPDHVEIVLRDAAQRLYLTLPGDTSDDKLESIADGFMSFIEDKYTQERISYEIRKDLKKKEYDIIIRGFYVANIHDAKSIIEEFISTLNDTDGNLIWLCLRKYCTDSEKPTILSKYHDSERKNELGELIKSTSPDREKILQIVNDSFYGVLDSSKTSPINVYINNFTNIQNQHNGDNNVKISPKDNSIDNFANFINFIKNDKPEWYQPGKFLPKAFITEKFNEIYDDDLSTRRFLSGLKKCRLYDTIIGNEKLDYYFTKNFGEEGKRYRGFIAKEI